MTPPFSSGNRIGPPLTDTNYGLALAMRNALSSYDYIVSQPTVLGPQASQRFLKITQRPRKPLTDKPLPMEGVFEDSSPESRLGDTA